jgi:serine phosphatase RsbU (regulator of sigma subunit)
METLAKSATECGVASIALPGHAESGDLHIFKPNSVGILIAAVDGVGHGSEAAAAALAAGGILGSYAAEPVITIVRHCHEGLRGTRGVAMSVASIDFQHGLMTWLGVGNVEGVLLRSGTAFSLEEESLLLRPGVVGIKLPALQAAVLPIAPGDALIFATDGIQRSFDRSIARSLPPQRAAQTILNRHAKGNDDALVLVVRFVGTRT